jgi:hypothetical protein
MTPEALKLIAKVEAKPKPVWRHRLHGFTVEVVNLNLFGNMIEMRRVQSEINYGK